MVTEKMIEALKPLADAVFNDNGDMTVQLPAITSEDCIKAYFAVRELAALSTAAEPVAWKGVGSDGVLDLTDRQDIADQWRADGIEVTPLYAALSAQVQDVAGADKKDEASVLRAGIEAAIANVDPLYKIIHISALERILAGKP